MTTIKNRRGTDKIISVYWFAILFLVAVAIVYVVAVFYGKPYDVRNTEADLLIDKITNCVSQGGYLSENWKTFNNDNFLQECQITLNTENSFDWSNDQYYLEVNFSDFNNPETSLKEVYAGNLNLKSFCYSEGDQLPVCLDRSFYSIDPDNKQYRINVLAVVRKTEKNVQ